MVKVTFEGDSISEIKNVIRDFFSDEEGAGAGEDKPKATRNRGPNKPKEAESAKVTHETIRKWINDNEDKKADVREILSDMQFDSVSEIPEDKLEKVLSKMKAL